MRRAFPWLPNGAHKTTFRLHRRNFGDAATHQPCPAPLRLCGGRLLGRLRFWLWRLARSTFVFLKNRRRLSARFRLHSSVGVKASLVYLSQTFSGPSCLLSRKSRPFSPLPSSSDTRRFQLFHQWAVYRWISNHEERKSSWLFLWPNWNEESVDLKVSSWRGGGTDLCYPYLSRLGSEGICQWLWCVGLLTDVDTE